MAERIREITDENGNTQKFELHPVVDDLIKKQGFELAEVQLALVEWYKSQEEPEYEEDHPLFKLASIAKHYKEAEDKRIAAEQQAKAPAKEEAPKEEAAQESAQEEQPAS